MNKCFNENKNTVAYKEFMYNSENVFHCSNCPENKTDEYRGCGQQNCWVTIHNKEVEEDDDI